MALHQRHATETFYYRSRQTLEGQPGHLRLQASMFDEEELDCAPHNRKTTTWTPNAFLSSLGHDTGFWHGHHQSIPPGIQTTPRLVLLLQSRRHRPHVRPGHRNEDRHRPTQAPSQKAPHHVPDPHHFHIPPHAHLHDSQH
jgi:hypothetical protein